MFWVLTDTVVKINSKGIEKSQEAMFTEGRDGISCYRVGSIYWLDGSEMCLGVFIDVGSQLLLQSLITKAASARLWPHVLWCHSWPTQHAWHPYSLLGISWSGKSAWPLSSLSCLFASSVPGTRSGNQTLLVIVNFQVGWGSPGTGH